MASSAVSSRNRSEPIRSPARVVTAIGVLMALACLGFATVNIVFVLTDHFAQGPFSEYASGLTVMNWLVVVLKVLGAALALLSVARPPRFPSPAALSVLLWGAFATLGVYAVGGVVEAVGMVSGLTGSPDQVDLAGIAYVSFFVVTAAGYGVLAISHSRRHRPGKGFAVLGVLGAPVVLGLILVGGPMLLVALGVMPAP